MKKNDHLLHGALITVALGIASPAGATDDASSTNPSSKVLKQIMVISDPLKIGEIAGSAHYISSEELDKHHYSSINEVLRQVPGVNIYDEEGYGLRPNIGMRGTAPLRSRKISMMEDGILASPAPYSSPNAYYSPMVGRMSAIEVVKGPGAIKYGPNTTAGALNFISTPIPQEFKANMDVFAGSDNFRQVHAYAGDATANIGWLAETYQVSVDGFKDLDGGGDTGFNVKDYMLKFRINTDIDANIYQELELKLVSNDEISNETYLGLTDADFSNTPYRRYAASQNDKMEVEHESVQLRHFIQATDNIGVTTVIYRNKTRRDWYKLGSVNDTSVGSILSDPSTYAAELAILQGGNSADDVLRITGADRRSISRGIQSTAAIEFGDAEFSHEVQVGLRFHYDEENRDHHNDLFRMENGSLMRTTAGAPLSATDRTDSTRAISVFIQDEMRFGQWIVTPGLRYETMDIERKDRRNSANSGKRDEDAFMPGIGVLYQLSDTTSLLGGVHKGFSPPGAGAVDDVDPEKSINYEAGVRYNNNALSAEAIAFFTDYSNLLGIEMAAGGGALNGATKNGGEIDVYGLELQLGYQAELGNGITMPINLAYTFTDTEFKTNFSGGSAFGGDVQSGDELIYVPKHHVNIRVGLESNKWNTYLSANYVGDMRSKAGSDTSADRVDAHTVFNLAGSYKLTENSRLFASLENLTDKVYYSSHTPTRNMAGKPRTFMAGVNINF